MSPDRAFIAAMIMLVLAVSNLALMTAFLRLRRRHRKCRHTLVQAQRERDAAVWDLDQQRAKEMTDG